jgi:nucleotide-binding universal stress UspA family protein
MFRSILVPLDGSAFAEHALPLAISLARRASATLHLVQVHVPVLAIDSFNLLDDALNGTLLERERVYLDDITRRVRERAPVPVRSSLPTGNVADELIEAARQNVADLIVMTTHGRGALSRFWLGSVADEIVRRGPAPVLLVRPPEGPVDITVEPPVRRVLVPLDGSPLAERVLLPTVEMAKLLGAEFSLIEVVPPVPILGYDLGGYAAAGTDLAVVEQMEATAHTYMNRVTEWLRARAFSASGRVVIDEQPAPAILEEARTTGCDLIALETHGRRGLSRMLLGSVADKVVRGATCAVLVHRGPYPKLQTTEAEPRTAEVAPHPVQVPEHGVGILS